MHDFFITLSILSDGIINLTLAITGIILWKRTPWKWRTLSLYFILLPFFVCIKYLLWPLFHVGNRFIDNLFINPIEMASIFLFLILSSKHKSLRFYLILLLILFFITYFIQVIFVINLYNEFPENLQLFFSILVILFSLFGIIGLFNKAERVKLEEKPLFWFYTALLLNYMPSAIIEYTRNLWSYTPESVNEAVYCVYYIIYILHAILVLIGYFHMYKNSKTKHL